MQRDTNLIAVHQRWRKAKCTYSILHLLAAMMLFLIGCQENGTSTFPDIIPEFMSVTAPDEVVKLADVGSDDVLTAQADLKSWTSSRVLLRYALSAEDVNQGARAVTVFDLCQRDDNLDDCSFELSADVDTNLRSLTNQSLPESVTVYFRWFIEYSLPDSNDPAYAASDLSVVEVGLLPPPKTKNDPTFSTFKVTPEQVCINQGEPFVRVTYALDPGAVARENWDNICFDVLVNGVFAHNTIRFTCMDDGLDGEYTFSLADYLGTNIPSSVAIVGDLRPRVAGNSYDIKRVTISTEICE